MDALRRFDWEGTPRVLGDVWTLRKNGRALVCRVMSHPLGWELRLLLDEDLRRSEVCRTEDRVFALADEWRTGALAKEWTAALV